MSGGKTRKLTLADAFQEGVALQRRGDMTAAERLYREIVKVQPDFAEAHNNLGVALKALDRFDEAVESYRRALAFKPDYGEARNNLARTLRALDRHEEAAEIYRQAVAAAPDDARAHVEFGETLLALKRHDEAAKSFRNALAIEPADDRTLNDLGVALEGMGRNREAVRYYRRALEIAPQHAGAQRNLGNALKALGRHQEAIECYREALAIMPNFADAEINLGSALQALNRHQEAIACFRRAQALKPDFAEAHWNESLAALCLGDFEVGWPKYEYRWHSKIIAKRPSFDRPLWLGGDDVDLSGKTILLYAEQGFGDTIQFVRFAPLVAGLGAAVILGVQPSLVALVANSLASLAPDHAGRVSVASKSDTIPPFDLACPLLSLPLALGTRVSTIPAAVPYLSPPPDRVAAWQARLGERRRRVGIAWSGKSDHVNDRHRTMPFSALAPLLSRPDIDFYVLQNRLRDGEREAVEKTPGLSYLGDELNDFADTAALTAAMDLVISVDTSIAHLAGALAKPVWVLLPFSPDWRWMLDRDDSPWYPTARLFRQPAIGDWDAVIARVTAAL
jgi:tetratricopeptide (TPR) repeat protein